MPRDQQRAWRQLADVTWGAKPSHVPAVEPVSFAGWSRSPAGVPVSQPRADASRRTCPALCSHTHARHSVKGERRGLRHDPSARGALVGRYPNACFRSRSDLKHPFGRGPGKVVSEASAARARGHAGPGLGFSQRGALIPPTQKRAHGARGTGRGERVGPRGGPGSAGQGEGPSGRHRASPAGGKCKGTRTTGRRGQGARRGSRSVGRPLLARSLC